MAKFKVDGHTRPLTWDDLKAGNVLRMVYHEADGAEIASAYSDATIVGLSCTPGNGTTIVRLARPYLYSTHDGTTTPGFLMGVEDYTVEGSRMIGPDSVFRLVLLSTGEPARMAQE